MPTLYIGTTYFDDGCGKRDESLTCIGRSYEMVYDYLAAIRKLPMKESRSAFQKPAYNWWCEITAIDFPTESAKLAFLTDERAKFMMQEYGTIDHRATLLTKKQAKNVWIPEIVISIVQHDVENFRIELQAASKTLKGLLYYIHGFDQIDAHMSREGRTLMGTCDMIDCMTGADGRIGINVVDGMYKRHPIYFCSEPEYRMKIKTQLEMEAIERDYRRALEQDD